MVEGYKILNYQREETEESKEQPVHPLKQGKVLTGTAPENSKWMWELRRGVWFPGLPPKKNGNYLGGKNQKRHHPSFGHHLLLHSTSSFHLVTKETKLGGGGIHPFQKLQDDYLTKCLSLLRSVLRGKRQKSWNSNLPEKGWLSQGREDKFRTEPNKKFLLLAGHFTNILSLTSHTPLRK